MTGSSSLCLPRIGNDIVYRCSYSKSRCLIERKPRMRCNDAASSRSFIHQLPTLPVSCPRLRLCRFRSIHSPCLREPPPSNRPRRLRLFGTSLKLVNLVFSITQPSYFHLSALSILFQLHSRGEDFSLVRRMIRRYQSNQNKNMRDHVHSTWRHSLDCHNA